MTADERAELNKAVLSIVRYLDAVPLGMRLEAVALVNTWLQIEIARDQRAQQTRQTPPVKDEHFDA